jgi:acyl carrier protein
MPEENLKDSIKTMMVEKLMLKTPKEEIGDDLPLFGPDGLGLDSIDALELVVSLEKSFGVTVPNSEAEKWEVTGRKNSTEFATTWLFAVFAVSSFANHVHHAPQRPELDSRLIASDGVNTLQNAFILQHGRGVLPQRHVGVRQTPRRGERFLLPVNLSVGLAQDFQRLAVVGICLRDDLEHLDGLEDLIHFLRGHVSAHEWIRHQLGKSMSQPPSDAHLRKCHTHPTTRGRKLSSLCFTGLERNGMRSEI